VNQRLPADQYVDSRNLAARTTLHARYSTNPQGWESWLFQQLELRDGLRILDLGCGPGGLWRSHLDSIPTGCRVVLTDSSAGMIAEASNNLLDARFEFMVAEAQKLPYPDEHFDCVTANHMLYHVLDLHRALSEIARVLKPRGSLCAATNGAPHMRQLHDIIRRSFPSFSVPTASFALENGDTALRRHFQHVAVRKYIDSLVVPDASALSAYVRSMASVVDATEQQLDSIEEAIRNTIHDEGPMLIDKAAGVFIAEGPRKVEPSICLTS